MRRFALLFAVLLLVSGCTEPDVPSNNTSAFNDTPMISVIPSANGSAPDIPVVPLEYSVNIGDIVWVNYTLLVNGSVIDTTNATLANESGIYNPARQYQPLMFTVEFNKGIIDGFVINTIGLKMNETVVFEVDPERGYGPYDPGKILVVPRYYTLSSFETVPRSYLESQGVNATKGSAFSTPYGTVFVNSTNAENVTLFYLFVPDHSFVMNGIPQRVNSTDSRDFTASIEYMLEMGRTYQLPHPETGAPMLLTVTDKTGQNITLDGNHPLANETLTFQVTLVDALPHGG